MYSQSVSGIPHFSCERRFFMDAYRGTGRALLLATGMAHMVVSTATAQTPVYRMRVLPDLGHGDVAAWAINGSGVVAGSAFDGKVTRPVRWEGNTPIPLTKGPQEAVYFWSNAINDVNHVVGTMRVNDQDFAFRHTPEGGLVQIITPIGETTQSGAFGINDAGVVVGQRDLHAVVLFPDGAVTEIRLAGAPKGLDYGHAAEVNSSNVVVGTTMGPPDGSRAGSSPRAFSWTAEGGIVNLVDFGFLASTTFANDVNDKGDVVGAASLGDPLNLVPQEACLWRHDEIVALADLNDGVSSNAVAINSAGHVLGYDGDDGGIGLPDQQHWIWIDGERHFLADLI